MIFSVRQQLVQEIFLSESQELESRLYLLNFFPRLPSHNFFSAFIAVQEYFLEIALLAHPHSHLT